MNRYCNPDYSGECPCCGVDLYLREDGQGATCDCGVTGICGECIVTCAECEPKGKESMGCKKCMIYDTETGEWFHDEDEANDYKVAIYQELQRTKEQ